MTDIPYTPGVQTYVDKGAVLTSAESAQRQIMRGKKFDTIAVHGLYNMEAALANQGSILEPAYLSPAQHFENSGHRLARGAERIAKSLHPRLLSFRAGEGRRPAPPSEAIGGSQGGRFHPPRGRRVAT